MVNTEKHHEHRSTRHTRTHQAGPVPKLVGLYLAVSVVTLVVLGLLSAVGSKEATSSAWVHAVIVAFFAVLLGMRMRAARQGSRRASVVVLIIATVLFVANIIEAAAPGSFPHLDALRNGGDRRAHGRGNNHVHSATGVEVRWQKVLGDNA